MAQTLSSAQSFAPPRAGFGVGGMMLALMAHGFLVAALTWGISWRNKTEIITASAELWAAVPTEAAAPLNVQQPAPVEPPPVSPEVKTPDIVLEKKKAKDAAEQLAKDLKAEAAKRKEQDNLRVREQIRQDQIKRMTGLAGATGSPSSTGTAAQSAAPSSSYAGKVKAKVRPNIVFQNADGVQGDPTVEIAIRVAPDGTVVLPLKIIKPSGNSAWDNAVLRGIEKTETLPRDNDGKFPAPFTLIWHLKE
jgi:colicin import membrane protein